MIFKEKAINIGDIIKYEDHWGVRGESKFKTGHVIEIYPHHVVLMTPIGYRVSVSNADLYTREGWK